MGWGTRSPVDDIVHPVRTRIEAFSIAVATLLLVAIFVSGILMLLRAAASCEQPARPAHFAPAIDLRARLDR